MRPRSLLAYVFGFSILLVALANASWWLVIRFDDSRPQGLAQFMASAVNLVRSALLTSDPELRPQLLQDLSVQEGIRLLPRDPDDQVEALPSDRFHRVVTTELRRLLGAQTQYALSVNQEPGLWVSFALVPGEEDEFWLILSRSRANRSMTWRWIGWGTLGAFFSLVVAWVLASLINRRLRRLMRAVRQVGRGQRPSPLPEEGPDELIQLAQAFNRMSRDLEYNEKERAEILAGISHDLRTPLARLRLEAEMYVPEDTARQGIVADITQMDAIIAQFLDYARGVGEEPLTPCDPRALLEALAEHEAAIQRPLTLEVAERLPEKIFLKPRAIQRALGNLLDNAWKYGAPPIRLCGRVEDEHLLLAVIDSGEGIPESEMERLKQPFTRRETARCNASGTGLGLAIAERVARDHGGSLELKGAPEGRGLWAFLKLPLSERKP